MMWDCKSWVSGSRLPATSAARKPEVAGGSTGENLPIQLGIRLGIVSTQVLDNKSNGGESGILPAQLGFARADLAIAVLRGWGGVVIGLHTVVAEQCGTGPAPVPEQSGS